MNHKPPRLLMTVVALLSLFCTGYIRAGITADQDEPLILIDWVNIGIDYRDVPPWRSYELYTTGNSVDECMTNALISEIDQDGGELRTYDFSEASERVKTAAIRIIIEAAREAGIPF